MIAAEMLGIPIMRAEYDDGASTALTKMAVVAWTMK
jgi:hypothetical protein